MNVMSAGCHPARSPPTAGSWLRMGTLARCCCPRSRRWSRDSTAPNPRERGRQSREQFTAGTRRAHWPLGRWAGGPVGRASDAQASSTAWPDSMAMYRSRSWFEPWLAAYDTRLCPRPTSAGLCASCWPGRTDMKAIRRPWPRRPAHARSSEGLPLPAGAEMIVIFFSAAWSSAATRSWRSISPGRAGLGGTRSG